MYITHVQSTHIFVYDLKTVRTRMLFLNKSYTVTPFKADICLLLHKISIPSPQRISLYPLVRPMYVFLSMAYIWPVTVFIPKV